MAFVDRHRRANLEERTPFGQVEPFGGDERCEQSEERGARLAMVRGEAIVNAGGRSLVFEDRAGRQWRNAHPLDHAVDIGGVAGRIRVRRQRLADEHLHAVVADDGQRRDLHHARAIGGAPPGQCGDEGEARDEAHQRAARVRIDTGRAGRRREGRDGAVDVGDDARAGQPHQADQLVHIGGRRDGEGRGRVSRRHATAPTRA